MNNKYYDEIKDDLYNIMMSIPGNVFFKDREGKYKYASDICLMLNAGLDEKNSIYGKTDKEIQPDPTLGRKFYEEDMEIIRTGKSLNYLQEMTFEDAGTFYYNICKQPVRNDKGEIIGVAGLINDLTEQVAIRKQLEEISKYDKMTGVYNRDYFEKTTAANYKYKMSYPAALFVADNNNLKLVNDTLGHGYGDLTIKATAQNLKEVFSDNELSAIFRVGGDEFLVIAQNCDEDRAKQYIKTIKEKEEKIAILDCHISTSVGYYIAENSDFDMQVAFDLADKMMYKEKEKFHSANKN